MSRSKSLSIEAAMQKLHSAAKEVRQRKGVKPHVQRRVEEALILLANGSTPEPMGARSESTYLNFLRNVYVDAGLSMVALCAIGLGKSAIGFLKDSIYLELPAMIHEQVAVLDSESLKGLAEGYPTKYIQSPALDPQLQIQGRRHEDQIADTQQDGQNLVSDLRKPLTIHWELGASLT